ncbi:MAG TPA: TetR/AcrR family transcriptional regulator [Candidatus Cloacimonetes bacterium]|nr:TetR/AcrR family transcriptional regulator [Candidatus Cloacimonadota bacterium]HEX37860.1 TetR/AcrR family transcriptional regulator [Candidatus Cloacimonadota bacterium]
MKLSERQQQIIDTSIKLIADHGIQSLTIKNISKEIGISEAALYRHFASKSEIIMAILNSFQKISCCVFDTVWEEGSTSIDKLKVFVMDRYDRFTENPKLAKVMFSEEVFQNDLRYSQKISEIMEEHKNKLKDIIQQGQEKNEIRNDVDLISLVRVVVGSMRMLVTQWCLSNFAFNLKQQGTTLWNAVQKLIT